ncbi:unnamed protein product [Bursaphelenchus xylophilus]|uniref:(pine wood nematode) hypothetical protein n=1 Tax=Bursaphelenchus xylophilus TaxID=6326 RepID=A0A1I7RMQ8_BURXY|nr:unnamed protein product [Bursaphelenchus xylophilus]CAG9125572.1 unnamed protein product [Bursaphelenchus xylophilus]
MVAADRKWFQLMWEKYLDLYGIKPIIIFTALITLCEIALIILQEYNLAFFVIMAASITFTHFFGRILVAVEMRPQPAKTIKVIMIILFGVSVALEVMCLLTMGSLLILGEPLKRNVTRLFGKRDVDFSYASNLFLLSAILIIMSSYTLRVWIKEHRKLVVRMRETPSFVDLFSAGSRLSSFVRLSFPPV